MNYYNENDPKAAEWLRELIRQGIIPNGIVDTRSICDVRASDLAGFTQCHFFAGISGWSLALQLAGWPSDRPVWTGSCPCQPFSAAGKGKGASDERHLWPVFRDLIRECRPEHVFGEQVANAVGHGWLDGVSTDLEAEGYAVGAVVLGAHSVGAPHIRQRLYWVANAESEGPSHGGTRAIQPFAGEFGGESYFDRLANADDRGSHGSGPRGAGRDESTDGGDVGGMGNASGDNERRSPMSGEHGQGVKAGGSGGDGWSRVVFAADCDDDGNCPVCGIDFADCGCFGPTQDGVEYDERPDGLFARWMVQPGQPGLEGHAGNGDNGNQSGRINSQPIGSAPEAGGLGAWSDFRIVHCLDGKARRIQACIEPSFLLLANGFYYRMASVRTEFISHAINQIRSYAETSRTDPAKTMFMVQNSIREEALQWAIGGQGELHSPEVLLPFLRDILSALNRSADYCGGQKASTQESDVVLRDMRIAVESQCASYRRESIEQYGGEPSNALRVLSWFLARCGQACGYSTRREDAVTFPLSGKVAGRVGLLRGYGNAIVPQVAAEFIKAFKVGND